MVNKHDSRQWDAQNNINVYRQEYRREGSKVRLLRPDLEEIRRDLEKKNERLEKENKRLREIANRRIKALNELLVCYRIGRQPSERLFKELKITEKKWSKLEGGGKQSTG